MIYDIALNIRYDYASPAAGGRHLVRLMPMDDPGRQRLIAGLLEIGPHPAERQAWADFFGNRTVEFAFRAPHAGVDLSLKARVERLEPAAPAGPSCALADLPGALSICRDLGPLSPLHFIAPSPRVPPSPEIAAYTREVLGTAALNVAEVVTTLGRALHRDIRFDASATTVDTPVAEAFAQRHGVCQDISHIMIAGLRGVGIPAAYVSGFLRTIPPPGQPRLEGADAMHAWVRAWCGPDLGWLEFDPPNDCPAGADHVEVARGRDYADVAPVKGMLRVAGGQTSRQAVDMVPLNG